jgi:arginine deiminase
MVRVTSEVGRLRRVLVHEPGAEVDRMVPAMMEELLFDDILFGDRAREEHRRFQRVLQLFGVELLFAEDLLAETLVHDEARAFILETVSADLPPAAREQLAAADPPGLVDHLVRGVRLDPSHDGLGADELYELPPLPNWCFQRDPQVVIGEGVVFSAMATTARYREALLARAIFRFHPAFAATPVLFDPLEPAGERHLVLGFHRPCLEGGDVLVLSPEVLAVGLSERTNRLGVQRLARGLARREGGPRRLVIVELPHRRAYMHLDTLLTPIEQGMALVYPPVMMEGGLEEARVYEVDLHDPSPQARPAGHLLPTLRRYGVDLEPVPCGGADPVAQQREQWTDGANAFALAPGVIALYDRNVATAEELARRGFRIVTGEDLLLGREEVDPDDPGRICVLIASHELSRARGGPHCLTHPLVRDPL